jgi:hypothetical protein
MPPGSDFTINYGALTVTHTSGTTVYTTLEFFQWLAAEFSQSAHIPYDYGIQSDTPTVFKWINGWAFGAPTTDYKFLKGGSIESSNGQELWSNLYSIGDQFRSSFIYIIQNGVEISPWWAVGNIDVLLLVKTGGALIDSGNVRAFSRDSDGIFDHNACGLAGGSRNPVGVNTGDDLNYHSTGDFYLQVSATAGFDVGNYVAGQTSAATARINYVDTGNSRLYCCMEEGGPFTVGGEVVQERLTRDGTSTGTTATLSPAGEVDAIRGYTDVKFAFVTKKFTGGTVGSGPFQVGETITQNTSNATFLYVGSVGTDLYVQFVSGTPDDTHQLVGGTSSATYTPTGSAAVTTIAKDMNNGAGAMPYRAVVTGGGRAIQQVYQYLKYVARHNATTPVINGEDGEQYRSASEGVYTDTKPAPFGTFAGGAFFGARGIWVEATLTAAYQLTDANGTLQIPPSYQKVTVTHASLVGCEILVAEISGGDIITDQYTIDHVTSNTIVATTSINANKTPMSGVLRIGDDKYAYTGFSSATFSGVTPDPTGKTGGFYVPFLDVTAGSTTEVSADVIYSAPVTVRAATRKYGFKYYEQDTNFGANGLSFSPILTVDPQQT